jgi:hypothetical protein
MIWVLQPTRSWTIKQLQIIEGHVLSGEPFVTDRKHVRFFVDSKRFWDVVIIGTELKCSGQQETESYRYLGPTIKPEDLGPHALLTDVDYDSARRLLHGLKKVDDTR